MDTKYTVIGLSERLEQLIIEINVALRPEKKILFENFIEIPKILIKINSIENQNTVRKSTLHILNSGYTNILSEFDYATYDKKNELIQVISDMEHYVLDYLKFASPDSADLPTSRELELIDSLKLVEERCEISSFCLDILSKVLQYTTDSSQINRQLALGVFMVQREYLWRSRYLKVPYSSWDNLAETDVYFQKFLSILEQVDHIFNDNLS